MTYTGLADRSISLTPVTGVPNKTIQSRCAYAVGLVGIRVEGVKTGKEKSGSRQSEQGLGAVTQGSSWVLEIVMRLQNDLLGRPQSAGLSLRPLHWSAVSHGRKGRLLTSPQDGGMRAACRGDGASVGGKERMEAGLAVAGFEGPPGIAWFRTAPRQTYWLR